MHALEATYALQISKLTGGVELGGDQNVHQWRVADTCSLRIIWEIQGEITIVNKTELPKMLEPIMLRQEAKGVEILGEMLPPSPTSIRKVSYSWRK